MLVEQPVEFSGVFCLASRGRWRHHVHLSASVVETGIQQNLLSKPCHLCCFLFCFVLFLFCSVRVEFGEPLAFSPSFLAHAIRFEGVWLSTSPFSRCVLGEREVSQLLSSLFKVGFLTYHDLLWPVFTVFAQIRCVWNVIKQYALKTVCPGNPPQCHCWFLDLFFFSFRVNAMYIIHDAQ